MPPRPDSDDSELTPGEDQTIPARSVRVGPFRVLRQLGRGGQGEVFEAVDERLQRRVALKVLSASTLALAPDIGLKVRARFEREAEVAARLDHPGICSVYEFGEHEGIPWIAMRLIPGESLQQLIRRRREEKESGSASEAWTINFSEVRGDDGGAAETLVVDPAQPRTSSAKRGLKTRTPSAAGSGSPPSSSRAHTHPLLEVVESVARAVHVAHEAGLVHRDLKPGNIMVTPEGQGVVLDFGLASDNRHVGPTLTLTGDLMGTPAYMAPEQITGDRGGIDRRTDVHALGATLFECLTLRRPFEAASRDALYRRILEQQAPALRRFSSGFSRDLETVVACALAKSPDHRYSTALDLAEDLRCIRERKPIAARHTGPITRAFRWSQRNPVIAILLASIIIGLAGASLWTAFKNRELSQLNEELTRTSERAQKEAQARARVQSEKTGVVAINQLLSDTRRLGTMSYELDQLWPLGPELVPKLEAWLSTLESFLDRYALYQVQLELVRREALPYTEQQRDIDHSRLLKRVDLVSAQKDDLEARLSKARTLDEETLIRDQIARIDLLLEAYRRQIAQRRTWDFPNEDLAFRHKQLNLAIAQMNGLTAPSWGLESLAVERMTLARRIHEETIIKPAQAWEAVRQRVRRDARFQGLDLKPQLGLIPLGPDPKSGLEEFLHWPSQKWSSEGGKPPKRKDKESLKMEVDNGVILVLIPGGSFPVGSQRESATAPNFDPRSSRFESPVSESTIDPFFLSKFELTKDQWQRTTGHLQQRDSKGQERSPERDQMRLLRPASYLGWRQANQYMKNLRLSLPTEVQWERAARCGTNQIWSGCSERGQLVSHANIAGIETSEYFSLLSEDHDDPFVIESEVGSLAPNSFGLHDMTGNVWELCLDAAAPLQQDFRPGDGLRLSSEGRLDDILYHIARGGSYLDLVEHARIAVRRSIGPHSRHDNIGLRPARAIDP